MRSGPARDPIWWQITLLLAISVGYESLFLHHGIAWLFDEGWPLYAAMKLHRGGTLYRDVFFVFPPGHLLPAWIAHGLAPPGVLLARVLYAGFDVALCLAIYLLGRRLMSPGFALLGAVLLAVAAPRSHLGHLLFGYRYLVFSALSLVFFSMRLRTGSHRWTVAAGLFAGISLCFRLTPAFAVACAVAVAAAAADRSWRSWLRDWGGFALGLLVAAVPVLAWCARGAGMEVLWRELVVRVVGLQGLQSLPFPDLALPDLGNRESIYRWFVSVQYRLYAALYAGYALVLGVQWVRSRAGRRGFEHALLLAVVLWGAVYLLRTLGRSDEHHLASALPPACLLLAHFLGLCFRRFGAPRVGPGWRRTAAEVGVGLAALGAWIFLQGTDLYLDREARGTFPLASLRGAVSLTSRTKAARIDRVVGEIRRRTEPGDRILDLANAPLLHVLTGREGPGYFDVVIPGTFLDEAEERAFVARLERSPPALVIWPERPFDKMPARSVARTAPLLAKWVRQRYRETGPRRRYVLMLPLPSPAGDGAP